MSDEKYTGIVERLCTAYEFGPDHEALVIAANEIKRLRADVEYWKSRDNEGKKIEDELRSEIKQLQTQLVQSKEMVTSVHIDYVSQLYRADAIAKNDAEWEARLWWRKLFQRKPEGR